MMTALEQTRRNLGLSQRWLAENTGLSASYISGVERGWHKPSSRFRRLVSGALGTSEEVLFPEPHKTYSREKGTQ